MSRCNREIGEGGITPVIATILLIGLTVVAVGVVAATLQQMQPSNRAPQVELGNIRAEVIQDGGDNLVTRVSFTHRGGDVLKPKELRVTIRGIDNNGEETVTSMTSTSDSAINFYDDTALILNREQEFSTPANKPYYPSGTEVEIFIIHEPTGTVLANVRPTVGKRLCLIYTDAGLGRDVGDPLSYSNAGATIVLSEVFDKTPEGEKSWRYSYTNAAGGWAGFYDNFLSGTKDMSAYKNLVFWVRGENGGENFEVFVEDDIEDGDTLNKYKVTATRDWQLISIPLSYFDEDLEHVKIPWNIAFSNHITGGDATVYVDFIRWIS